MSNKKSFNPKAGSLYEEDLSEFMLKSMKSVEESIDYFDKNIDSSFNTQSIPEG